MSDEAYAEIADLRNRLGEAESQRDLLQSRLSGQTKLTGMLQKRAEKAEDLLRAVAFDDQHKLQVWLEPLYIREPYVKVLVDKATDLLSPTQETDPTPSRRLNE